MPLPCPTPPAPASVPTTALQLLHPPWPFLIVLQPGTAAGTAAGEAVFKLPTSVNCAPASPGHCCTSLLYCTRALRPGSTTSYSASVVYPCTPPLYCTLKPNPCLYHSMQNKPCPFIPSQTTTTQLGMVPPHLNAPLFATSPCSCVAIVLPTPTLPAAVPCPALAHLLPCCICHDVCSY
jgi:hypothetical protein